eukprot:scaffold29.g5967.t1
MQEAELSAYQAVWAALQPQVLRDLLRAHLPLPRTSECDEVRALCCPPAPLMSPTPTPAPTSRLRTNSPLPSTTHASTPQSPPCSCHDGDANNWCCLVHRAAAEGNLPLLQALLTADPALARLPDSRGMLPLHHAAQHFQLPTVEALPTAGADASDTDSIDYTAVHRMAGETWVQLSVAQHLAADGILHRLAAAGQDLLACATNGYTPLHEAVASKNIVMARLLLKHDGVAVAVSAADHTLFSLLLGMAEMNPIAGASVQLLETLLQHGAPANARCPATGTTPLLEAARTAACMEPKHGVRLLQLLLSHSADPRAVDNEGCNCFHYLCEALGNRCIFPPGFAAALRVLLPVAGGASALNTPDAERLTPIWRVRKVHEGVDLEAAEFCVHELLQAGADLQARADDGWRFTLPEDIACSALRNESQRRRALRLLELLRAGGLGREQHWNLGRHRAGHLPPYDANFWAVLDQLLEWGADPNAHPRDPSIYAKELAASWFDASSRGRRNTLPDSPLRTALCTPLQLMQRLVAAGADASQGDQHGRPLLLLLWERLTDVVSSHIEDVRCDCPSTRKMDLTQAACRHLRGFLDKLALLRAAGAPPLSEAERGRLGMAPVRWFFSSPDDEFPEWWEACNARNNLETAKSALLFLGWGTEGQQAEAPAAFRAAARTLLLINRWRGFPAAAPGAAPRASAAAGSPAPEQRRQRQRTKAHSLGAASGAGAADTTSQQAGPGSAVQQCRVSLEPDVMQAVLRFAAADVAAWVKWSSVRPWTRRPPEQWRYY